MYFLDTPGGLGWLQIFGALDRSNGEILAVSQCQAEFPTSLGRPQTDGGSMDHNGAGQEISCLCRDERCLGAGLHALKTK